MPFIPHTPDETAEMLSVIGVRTLDDLFADIPQQMRPAHFNLPKGLSESAVCGYFENLAARNRPEMVSFLGAGFYAHKIPAAVDALSGRSEFYTAYTPYQAECSQGTLQAIFEYQTAVCRLLDMDCANASVYDGGSALFEACMTAVRVSRRKVIVVDECVNPIWRVQLGTYTSDLDVDVRVLSSATTGAYNSAALRGVPSLLIERGGNGVWSRAEVDAYKRDIRALLAHLQLLPPVTGLPCREQREIRDAVYLTSKDQGCWYPEVTPGAPVSRGTVLGTVRDIFGRAIDCYRAEKDGIILYMTVSLAVKAGTPLVAYG